MSGNSRKRPRTESLTNPGEAAIPTADPADFAATVNGVPVVQRVKDSEFWLADGNLILATADVEFRVYQGILCQHSAVFHDMFALPQPPDAPVSEDGIPIIEVSDRADDLRHVLRSLMSGNEPR